MGKKLVLLIIRYMYVGTYNITNIKLLIQSFYNKV